MINRIRELRDKAQIKLNIGSGDFPIEGSVNIDLHGDPDVRADARSLPYPNSSVDWLESHHLLEHFDLADGALALDEWVRVLKPKGMMLITAPDLLAMVPFMIDTRKIIEVWRGINMAIYGQSGPGMRHLSTYSPEYLTHCLEQRGISCEVIPWPYRPTPSFGVLGCRI